MKKNGKRNEYWKEFLLVVLVVLLTLWQISFIDWFPDNKAIISRIIYFLALCCLVYFLIDDYKDKNSHKQFSHFTLIIAIVFLLLLVYSFLPANLKNNFSFLKILE